MELVLVFLETGCFFRAKVLEYFNDQRINVNIDRCMLKFNGNKIKYSFVFRFQVFLLDYGTTHDVELRRVYKWTPQCDKFPFLVVLFELSNLRVRDASDPNVINYVQHRIPKTFVSAEVT